MGLLSFLPIIGSAVDKLLDLIPDPNQRAKAEAEYRQAVLEATIAETRDQREINKVEAAHRSIFVAGWRPAIGWVCAAALAYQYIVRPFAAWGLAVWMPGAPALPTLDGMLWELVFGMLGMGALRTGEKLKGAAQ